LAMAVLLAAVRRDRRMGGARPARRREGTRGGGMTELISVAGLREYTRRHNVLVAVYIAFLALILAIPDAHAARWAFYVAVLPALVVTIDRGVLAAVIGATVWRGVTAFLVCLWLSVLWGETPNAADALDYARRVIMTLLFVTATAVLAAS